MTEHLVINLVKYKILLTNHFTPKKISRCRALAVWHISEAKISKNSNSGLDAYVGGYIYRKFIGLCCINEIAVADKYVIFLKN